MIPLEEAQARVWAACEPLPTARVALASAHGRVLAEDVVSAEAVPPFANSAMDGYAVRAADVASPGAELEVVGHIPAGAPPEPPVGPGQAVRIMTGAPVPPGADSIAMVEITEVLDDGARVRIRDAVARGTSVRPAGDDIDAGQTVCRAGEVLTPGRLGLLASVGVTEVACVGGGGMRVGVISTGDELVDDGGPLGPGQIRDSNRRTLLGMVAEAGVTPVDLGLVRDDKDALRSAFERGASTCDAICTSGGVSVGDFDYVKQVLDELSGGTFTWMQVAIKPAKPFAFGTLRGPDGRRVPVFGLPGNSVSSMVSFEVFARPGIRRMLGFPAGFGGQQRAKVSAVAGEDFRRGPDTKLHLVRVLLSVGEDGGLVARSAGGQASHLLSAMAAADALALLPDGAGVAAGERVDVLLTGWPR